MNVGVVGCGVIARQYVANAREFDSFWIVACADVARAAAQALAAEHGLGTMGVEELIGDPGIDVVLNLTPPSAHAAVIGAALAEGKHVYSEKPLTATVEDAAALVADAEQKGLRIGCAPDTFLGGGFQAARGLIDEGAIGAPLAVSASVFAGGQTTWHPNPDIFYADGAGPLLDFGPYYVTAIVSLLGPVRRVSGFASTRTVERVIAIGPRAGERFEATTPTQVAAGIELESGVTASLLTSFEVEDPYLGDFHVYGTEGALALPDPNGFAGPLRVRRAGGDWREVEWASRGARDARGIGLHDMVEAIAEDRPQRASGRLALHVLDVCRAVLTAAVDGTTVDVRTSVERPEPMSADHVYDQESK